MLDHQIIGYIRSFIYHPFPDSFSIVDVFSIPRLPHLGAHPLAILSISLHRVGGKLIFPAIFPLFVLSSQLHYRPFNHCTLGVEKAKSMLPVKTRGIAWDPKGNGPETVRLVNVR